MNEEKAIMTNDILLTDTINQILNTCIRLNIDPLELLDKVRDCIIEEVDDV